MVLNMCFGGFVQHIGNINISCVCSRSYRHDTRQQVLPVFTQNLFFFRVYLERSKSKYTKLRLKYVVVVVVTAAVVVV